MIPPIVRRFIAGEDIPDVLDYAESLYEEENIIPLLNQLGEHYTDEQAVKASVEEYVDLIQAIHNREIIAEVSVKPSQLGYDISPGLFEENLNRVANEASAKDVFLWVDMEDHKSTEDTINAFRETAEMLPHQLGLCVQANLRRTADDLEDLVGIKGKIRLVKGAYNEPKEIAFAQKESIDSEYLKHLRYLFENHEHGIAVASHDDRMVSNATVLHASHEADFEVQMLKGVRESYQRELADEYAVRQYAPYGSEWARYVYRRLRERKNLGFIIRAVINR